MNSKGVSPVISTMIISGTLLIILVVALFVSANVLELQLSSTEFEQAKSNMILLDDVIQDVALRQGSGGYVQFNQRSGGIGITEHAETFKIIGPHQPITLKPNAAGTHQTWSIFGGSPSRWQATSDQNDATGVQSPAGNTTAKETENLQDTTQTGTINSVTAHMKAKAQPQVAFVAAGTGDGTTSGNPTPAYPSGLQANDLILLQVTVRDTSTTPTTPTGFTALYGPDSTGTGRQWIYYKFSFGNETGTITVTIGGSACKIARMYAFRNVATTSFTEGGGFGTWTDSSIEAQSVTTTGFGRLAVSFVFVNNDNDVGSFTGETGGNWTEAVTEFIENPSGSNDGCIQLQTATMASFGTISGGSYTMDDADPWGVRAFALIPGAASDEQAVMVWRTHNADYESSAVTISRTSFTDYSEQRTTNPNTGSAWTWDEVNALEIGSRASTVGPSEYIQVSEFWIVVNYTSVQSDIVYESPPLVSLVYRGGSHMSGSDITLRGENSLNVSMSDSLSYLRIETGQGVQIKLDYNRVRIVETGPLVVNDTSSCNLVEVTFLRLVNGTMGGSGTVNLKAQNIGINTTPYKFVGGTVTIQFELGSNITSRTFCSDASETVLMFTEIRIQISI
jgi:hypothetical protein